MLGEAGQHACKPRSAACWRDAGSQEGGSLRGAEVLEQAGTPRTPLDWMRKHCYSLGRFVKSDRFEAYR